MAGPALVQAAEGQAGECAAQHPRKKIAFFPPEMEYREILKVSDVTGYLAKAGANVSFIANIK